MPNQVPEVGVDSHLVGAREQPAKAADEGVKCDIEPAANGIVGRVFPRLQAVAVREVVRRLPVVERLVAVLDGRKGGGDQVGDEEDVKRLDWFNGVCADTSEKG